MTGGKHEAYDDARGASAGVCGGDPAGTEDPAGDGRAAARLLPGGAGPDGAAAEAGTGGPGPGRTHAGLEIARDALAAARARARGQLRTGARAAPGSTSPSGWVGRGAATGSGAGPDERDPQLLNRAVDRLLAERGWQTEAAVATALTRWRELVGRDLAAHCRPRSAANGELVLETDSTAWATQVRLLVPALLARLNEELGPGTVTRIRVLGPAAPSWRKGSRSVRGRGPRDTYG